MVTDRVEYYSGSNRASDLDEREPRGLFEMSIYQMSELKMSYENCLE